MQVLVPPTPFITREETLAYMNKKVNQTPEKAEILDLVISAACSACVERVGYIGPAVIRERVRFVNNLAVTTARPVISIETEGYTLENREGVVSGSGVVELDYTAGRSPVPDNFKLAGLEMAVHVWNSSQNNQTRPIAGTADQVIIPQTNWLLPIRVREMLGLARTYRDTPFVAVEQEL